MKELIQFLQDNGFTDLIYWGAILYGVLYIVVICLVVYFFYRLFKELFKDKWK